MGKKKRKSRTAPGGRSKTAATASHGRRYDWTLLGTDLLIVVPAFVFLPGIADSFRLPKLVVTSTLAMAACALLLLRLLRYGRSQAARAPWRSRLPLALAPLLAVASLGLWTSDHPGMVARTLPVLWAGAAFLVALTTLLDGADRRRLLQLLVWPASALAALGLLQSTGMWQPMSFEDGVSERLAVTSLAGGAFDLSAYLLLPLLWCQHRLWTSRGGESKGLRRWIWYPVVGLLAATLLATQTLSVLVAALAASSVLWLLQLRIAGVPKRRLAMAFTAASLLMVVAVLVVAPLRTRVASKARLISRGEINVFLTGRVDGWRAGLWMLSEQPVSGVGTGVYSREFGDARLALQQEGVTFWARHKQPYFANAHNDLVEALAEWGVPGLLALAWLLFWLARGQRAAAPGTATSDPVPHHFLASALVAMVIVSLTNFPWHLALIAFPWLLVLAEIFDRGDAHGDPESEPRPVAVGPVCVLVVLSLVASAALFLHGKDRIGAQRLVRTVESLAMEGGRRGQMPPRVLDLGLDMLRQAEDLDPSLTSVKITRGGLFMVAGRQASAERTYQEALVMQNRAEIWVNLARLRLSHGDSEGALQAAQAAQSLGARVGRDLPEFRHMLNEDAEVP